MTKEYTGSEFEIEFHTRYLEWLKAGKVGVDPRNDWEFSDMFKGWSGKSGLPLCNSKSYRWKPAPKRMVTIGWYSLDGNWISKTLVAPEVKAPASGAPVFHLDDLRISHSWSNEKLWTEALKDGKIFLSPDDCSAMSDWLAVCRNVGEV